MFKCFKRLFRRDKKWLYIFVRQDISPEYQAVQAAHATFVAGKRCPARFNPDNTWFCLIGVPDLAALKEAREWSLSNRIGTFPFYEGDLNDEMTAFTTTIVRERDRAVFGHYERLRFN